MDSSSASDQLLGLRPLLEWLPGETLFSLCSRYHHIAGHRLPEQSCKALFGTQRAGSAHDVPAHVQALADRTHGALGTAREIILRRSLMAFYFPFHPAYQCENWLDQMSAGASPFLKAQLGLAASQFGAAHPLKACPMCMPSDAAEYGIAYWHVEHQLPGVVVCPVHRKTLLVATDKVSGQNRFSWVLPAQARWEAIGPNQLAGGELRLSEAALAMWQLPVSFTFAPDRLICLYKTKLGEQGFIDAATSRVNHKRFEVHLVSVLAATSMTTHWPWLSSFEQVGGFSRRLFRLGHPSSPRFSRHPLNHLPLILMLFGSWDDFWSEYHQPPQEDSMAPAHHMARVAPAAFDANASLRLALAANIRSGLSVSSAAALAGVSVNTAITWAAKEGIRSRRRPKALKPEVRSTLIQKLQHGADKSAVASFAGISVETVTRLLMTEPGLHERWSSARFGKTQKRSRSAWLDIQQAFPEASSNEWRTLNPSAYAWLYRNDRAWLQSAIRNRPLPTEPKAQRRDWQTRDTSLAQAVRSAALHWHALHPRKRLTVSVLCASVSELRPKLSALHKLPLTRQALRDACAAHPSRPSTSDFDSDSGFQG